MNRFFIYIYSWTGHYMRWMTQKRKFLFLYQISRAIQKRWKFFSTIKFFNGCKLTLFSVCEAIQKLQITKNQMLFPSRKPFQAKYRVKIIKKTCVFFMWFLLDVILNSVHLLSARFIQKSWKKNQFITKCQNLGYSFFFSTEMELE